MISPEIISQIKNSLNIADVIGDFITLRSATKNHTGVCPFHDDTKPSLIVSSARQTYKCFACGAGGDVIEFVKEYEKISFVEAAKWCADRAGIKIDERQMSEDEQQEIAHKKNLRMVITSGCENFHKNIVSAMPYLDSRGIADKPDVIERYKIGYAPSGNILSKNMIAKGISQKSLLDVDLVREGRNGVYDTFQDRITFPFFDLSGNVIGFSARLIAPKGDYPKYLNTSDTVFFHKSDVLFGLYQAKRYISDNVYLCEGQLDVVSLAAYGVTNTVACSGTALTDQQVRILSRLAPNVILMYDSDTAGVKAAYTAASKLLSAGLKVSCVALPQGKDPDDIAQEHKKMTKMWIEANTESFVKFFSTRLLGDISDTQTKNTVAIQIAQLIALMPNRLERDLHTDDLAKIFGWTSDLNIAINMVSEARSLNGVKRINTSTPGVFGMDVIDAPSEQDDMYDEDSDRVYVTTDYQQFVSRYGNTPVIYVTGTPTIEQIQELRILRRGFYYKDDLWVRKSTESTLMSALATMYKNGITDIIHINTDSENAQFLEHYLLTYKNIVNPDPKIDEQGKKTPVVKPSIDKTPFVERCIELISCSPDNTQTIIGKTCQSYLDIQASAYNKILAKYNASKKRKNAPSYRRPEPGEWHPFDPSDPTKPNRYVYENPIYREMYEDYGFFPRINKDGEPIGYIFSEKESKGGGKEMSPVGDFFLEPLLHIYDSKDPEKNRRIIKLTRRRYAKPLYLDIRSVDYLKKASIELVFVNLPEVNFENGTDAQWNKIRINLSRRFTSCEALELYGNQLVKPLEGHREQDNFFAFSNAIFHYVDGVPRIDFANELGVVEHHGANYYLPAFSVLSRKNVKIDDPYEDIKTLKYTEAPADKRCTFEHWASLMDQVYKINDNGKWALIYAIMCAFRSNIFTINGRFTAPFFVGPKGSGKSEIGISIRSLFMSSEVAAFSLMNNTDAAMSTLMSKFCDVPVLLEEYNNTQISDYKYQALKSIVYDGFGKKKRSGTGTNDITTDKIYAPVMIVGQETPQQDDNSLFERVIICEVPKPQIKFGEQERTLLRELKSYQNWNKIGLSNVLFDVLKLRPLICTHYSEIYERCIKQMMDSLQDSDDGTIRIIENVSYFTTMVQFIETQTDLKLPFTYDEFFAIAKRKIITQASMIAKTDKVASFIKSMEAMISQNKIRPGEFYSVDIPTGTKITINGGTTESFEFIHDNRKILYLRVGSLHEAMKNGYNPDKISLSTLEQNIRSNPAYIGEIKARRFKWMKTVMISRDQAFPHNNLSVPDYTTVSQTLPDKGMFKCIAMDYEKFRQLYDVDFEYSIPEDMPNDLHNPETLQF